jgi:hypothetical protein
MIILVLRPVLKLIILGIKKLSDIVWHVKTIPQSLKHTSLILENFEQGLDY